MHVSQKRKESTSTSCTLPSFILRQRASLHSHHQWRSVPCTPQHPQHKFSSMFLIFAVLTGVIWNLRVVLISICLMAKELEHFPKYLSAILDSSVQSSLFWSVLNFFTGLFVLFKTNPHDSVSHSPRDIDKRRYCIL